MKILVAGDSWNYGYGLDSPFTERWDSLLEGHEIKNVSISGSGNALIERMIMEHYDNHDLIIVGWSSVQRVYLPGIPRPQKLVELVLDSEKSDEVLQARLDFFQYESSYDKMFKDFKKQIRNVESLPCKVIHFTVFGDKFPVEVKHKIDKSFLEFLANLGGYKFLFDIPFFEYGFLMDTETHLIETFCDNHFPKDWRYACYERELPILDECKYFLVCGHPSKLGHIEWSKRIEQEISKL